MSGIYKTIPFKRCITTYLSSFEKVRALQLRICLPVSAAAMDANIEEMFLECAKYTANITQGTKQLVRACKLL